MSQSDQVQQSPLFGSEDSSTYSNLDALNNSISLPCKRTPSSRENGKFSKDDTPHDDEYVVEKILARALDSKDSTRYVFLVKWEGYNYYQSSWEPEENLAHAQTALQEFLENEDDFDIDAFEKQKHEWDKHQRAQEMKILKQAKAKNTVFKVRKGMSNLGGRR